MLLVTLPELTDVCLQNAAFPNGRVLDGYWNLVCMSVPVPLQCSPPIPTLPPQKTSSLAAFNLEGYLI